MSGTVAAIQPPPHPAVGHPAIAASRTACAGGTMHSIQCLRAVAATLVVIYHAYISFVPSALYDTAAGAGYWMGFGRVGVHIFFVISGYIMYLTSFGRPGRFGAGQFFVRRLTRIYPVYWVFVALYLIAYALLGTMPMLSGKDVLGVLLLAPATATLVIGPAWTLSFELYFYLIFGITMLLGAGRGTLVLTVLFLGSVAASAVIDPRMPLMALATNSLLLEFVMGVWVARLTTRHAFSNVVGYLVLAGAVAGFAIGLMWGYDRLPSAILWGVPSALLIAGAVIVEQRSRIDRHGLTQRLSWLGDSSYALYLCHILLITLVVAALRPLDSEPPLLVLMIATTLGCIAFAALFHIVIERPMTRFLHRTLPGSKSIKRS